MSILNLILGLGQSGAPGGIGATKVAITTTADPYGNVMLAPLALGVGEVGANDGTVAPMNRVVDTAEWTAFAPLLHQTRTRLFKPIDVNTNHFTTPESSVVCGETPGPAMCAYLNSRDSGVQRYCWGVAALPSTKIANLAGTSDMKANGRAMVQAIKRIALASGYSGVVCDTLVMNHGQSDANSSSYAADLESFRLEWATALTTDLGVATDPYLVNIGLANQGTEYPGRNQQYVAEMLYAKQATALPQFALATDGVEHYHWTSPSQLLAGSYFGRWRQRYVVEHGRAPGLRIKRATFWGNRIVVEMDPALDFTRPLLFAANSVVTQQTNQGIGLTSDSGAAIANIAITGDNLIIDTDIPLKAPVTLTIANNADGYTNVCDSSVDKANDGTTNLTNWLHACSIDVPQATLTVRSDRGRAGTATKTDGR